MERCFAKFVYVSNIGQRLLLFYSYLIKYMYVHV